MRFYLKLSLFVLAFIVMHRLSIEHQEQIRRADFAIRCGMAYEAADQQRIEQLILEARHLTNCQSRCKWPR